MELITTSAPVPVKLDCGHLGARVEVTIPVSELPTNTTVTSQPAPAPGELAQYSIDAGRPQVVVAICDTCGHRQRI